MNIIDKIRKLLKLGSNNTSEEEMAAAMAKAAELAMKNGLDIESIQADDDQDGLDDFDVGKLAARMPPSEMVLWNGLASVFGAKCMITTYYIHDGRKRQRLHVIAPKGIKETLLYLGQYLQREMRRKYLEEKRMMEMYCVGQSTERIRKAFMWGFADRITYKVHQIFQAQSPECHALVLQCSRKVLKKVDELSEGRKPKEVGDPGRGVAVAVGMWKADETDVRRPLGKAKNDAVLIE